MYVYASSQTYPPPLINDCHQYRLMKQISNNPSQTT